MGTAPLRLPWSCVVCVQPCLGRSSGGGAGGGCELQRAWDPARASFPWPACGSQHACSGRDPSSPLHQLPAFLFPAVPAAGSGAGKAWSGLYCPPLPQRRALLLLTFSLLPQPRASCFPQGEFPLPVGAAGTIMNGCSLAGGSRRGCKEDPALACSPGQAWVRSDTKRKEVLACPAEEQAALGGAGV